MKAKCAGCDRLVERPARRCAACRERRRRRNHSRQGLARRTGPRAAAVLARGRSADFPVASSAFYNEREPAGPPEQR